MIYLIAIPLLWSVWMIYWVVAASDTKPVERRETLASRAAHVVPLFIAVLLVAAASRHAPPDWAAWLYTRVIPRSQAGYWIGIAVLTAGLGFSVWGRLQLGRNWSGTVTVKRDHELIRTGPYRYVRHPIYTGILFGFIGTAIALGQVRGLISLALVLFAFLRKLRLEERWMTETFGAHYADYRKQVKALIPFVL
jgi:protein-S-isoprenylcysteine O-methyltransferase Ste14